MSEDTKAYPMMPIKSWWALRKKFHSSIPSKVSPNYVATVLGVTELAAKNNILPTMRRVGLIDSTGKTEPLATSWRDDTKYPDVCSKILEHVYPSEIRDIAPDKSADRDQIQAWFANHTSSGVSAARKMSAFYAMLLEADPNVESATPATPITPRQPHGKKAERTPARTKSAKEPDAEASRSAHAEKDQVITVPEIHVNLQIHISSDSTAEQIDKIFSSMSKHLKDMKS